MNLKKYDSKCVKIDCIDGKVYEGYCYYNNHEYCYHEYGRDEDSLQIMNILFFQKDIKKIISLENNKGPYGKFTEPFGEVEKMIVEDGISFIDDAFESEENEHIYRILLCLENIDLNNEIIGLLKKLIKYNKDKKIIDKASKLIKKGGINEDN